MNTETLTKNIDLESRKNSAISLLQKLRNKVKNLTVVDKQGQIIGEIKDLILDDNRQLSFVVSQLGTQTSEEAMTQLQHPPRLYLLTSKQVNKVDADNRTIITNFDKSQLQYLPSYYERESQISEIPNGSSIQNENIHDTKNIFTTTSGVMPENFSEVNEEIIRLLEERLVVNSSKRKVGEVIVRKEIETRMIQVPVRREKLIVEQVGEQNRQLAEILLDEEKDIAGIELLEGEKPEDVFFDNGLTVSGEFDSPKIASLLLNAINLERNNGCRRIRVTISVEDEARQKKYQEWFNRTSVTK